jgi:hypothetical protein
MGEWRNLSVKNVANKKKDGASPGNAPNVAQPILLTKKNS